MRLARTSIVCAGSLASIATALLLVGCDNPDTHRNPGPRDTSGASSEATPVLLRYRWQPGERVRYRIITQGDDTDKVESTSNRSKIKLAVELEVNAVQATQDGGTLLEAQVAHYAHRNTSRRTGLDGLEVDVPLGQVQDGQSFPVSVNGLTETFVMDDRVQVSKDGILVGDNKSRNGIVRGVGEGLLEMLPRNFGSRAEISHSPQGLCTIGKRAGSYFAANLADSEILSPVALLVLVVPEQAVRPGDSWQVPYRLSRLGEHELAEPLEGTVTFSLLPEPVPDRPVCVRVAVTDSVRLEHGRRAMKFHLLGKTYDRVLTDLERTSSGEVIFDPMAGRVVGATLQTRTTARMGHILPSGEELPHLERGRFTTQLSLLEK